VEFWFMLISDLNALQCSLRKILQLCLTNKKSFIFFSYSDLCIISPNRHFLICLYGAAVLGLIFAGQLRERKIIYILTGKYLLFMQY
jgi:hypothetical protein